MSQRCAPERILIVDDEPTIRWVLLRYLQTEKTDCVASHNAFDALDKIRNQQFSIVISDILMPGMSGIELLSHVREQDPETAVIMLTGLRDLTVAVDSLRRGACDFITKPFDLSTVHRAVDRALQRRRLIVRNRFHREQLEGEIRQRTFELDEALREVEESYNMTLQALVTALDAREHETQAHSKRVQEYTLSLAREMGIGGDELIQAGRGALLHDVGKIGVRDSILLKPSKLTTEEWIEMRKHPQIGYEILRSIEFLAPAAQIVLCHQERWDGNGYPNRLIGSSIPQGARIFAVADTLDAMTTNRPYRNALPFEAALEEIRSCSGSQFDPQVVSTFLSIPIESWMAIHHNVNKSYQNQGFEAICPI